MLLTLLRMRTPTPPLTAHTLCCCWPGLTGWLTGRRRLLPPSLPPSPSPVALQVPQAQLLAGKLKVAQAHAPQPRVEGRQAGRVHFEGSHLQGWCGKEASSVFEEADG